MGQRPFGVVHQARIFRVIVFELNVVHNWGCKHPPNEEECRRGNVAHSSGARTRRLRSPAGIVHGYGVGRVWKIGHPTSVRHNDSSGVSEGPTR